MKRSRLALLRFASMKSASAGGVFTLWVSGGLSLSRYECRVDRRHGKSGTGKPQARSAQSLPDDSLIHL